jgi:predicted RNA-binding Zn-ribbon protein involved in translation (DUF1610 family)
LSPFICGIAAIAIWSGNGNISIVLKVLNYMKKKIFLSLAVLFGVVAFAYAAWTVDTQLSFRCPSCGNTIVRTIQSNATESTELGGCPKCNKHYIMKWRATGNGGAVVTSVQPQ